MTVVFPAMGTNPVAIHVTTQMFPYTCALTCPSAIVIAEKYWGNIHPVSLHFMCDSGGVSV